MSEEVSMDGFKPCPICGRNLGTRDIYFCMEDGEVIEELADIADHDNILNPDNALPHYDRSEMDDEEQLIAVKVLNECVDCVEFIGISCSCGFHFYSNRDNTIFPSEGWMDQFKALVNKRWYDDDHPSSG